MDKSSEQELERLLSLLAEMQFLEPEDALSKLLLEEARQNDELDEADLEMAAGGFGRLPQEDIKRQKQK
ncbi:MAG: hypothetical protein ACK5L3_11220 [Oscillospiraceae bacterium]